MEAISSSMIQIRKLRPREGSDLPKAHCEFAAEFATGLGVLSPHSRQLWVWVQAIGPHADCEGICPSTGPMCALKGDFIRPGDSVGGPDVAEGQCNPVSIRSSDAFKHPIYNENHNSTYLSGCLARTNLNKILTVSITSNAC